jgi:ABC-type amino acid transport system permease subunit
VQERIDLSRLLSKIPNTSPAALYMAVLAQHVCYLSLHAEIFRDAMRDVFGIFFVAFITGTPLLACHFLFLSAAKAE